jgi:hypothetical protein
MIDHRMVRVGLLARVIEQDGWVPHQAVRITVAPPISGPTSVPSLRADWLDSWKLDKQTWLHINASYMVTPAPFSSALAPGRSHWWQARVGLVRALTATGVVLAGSVAVVPSPFESVTRPKPDLELAVIVPVTGPVVISLGGGALIEAYREDSLIRAQAGVSWLF